MKIQIDELFQIVSDDNQYILQERKVVQDGKTKGSEYFTNQKYFGTIEGVLKCYKETQIRRSDCQTLNDVLELARGLDKKIDGLLKR